MRYTKWKLTGDLDYLNGILRRLGCQVHYRSQSSYGRTGVYRYAGTDRENRNERLAFVGTGTPKECWHAAMENALAQISMRSIEITATNDD